MPEPDFSFGAPTPHGPLRTFHPRRSPLGPARRDALERLWRDCPAIELPADVVSHER